MVEVSGSLVRGMLAMAEAEGLAIEPLVRSLPFDGESIHRMRNVSWDDYCTVVERFEDACGGPDAHVAVAAKQHRELLAPEVRGLMGGLISPQRLLQFVIRTLCPHSFPTVDFACARQTDGRFLVSGRLRSAARPCEAFFRGSLPYMQHVTEHLGLPPSEIELCELTARSLVFLMRLPESRTIVARVKRRSRAAFGASLGVMRQFAAEARQRSVELLATRASLDDVAALGRALAQHQDLDALASAIGEMLNARGWQYVALSVTAIGERAPRGVLCRGTPGGREYTTELVVAGRSVGTLELGGHGDPRLVDELAPWLAITIDNARTFGAIRELVVSDHDRLGERMADLERRHGLSVRQLEVLARVVRGHSNKEIAAELACAENTVEHHVTQLFRKTETSGRTQLVALFWAGRP